MCKRDVCLFEDRFEPVLERIASPEAGRNTHDTATAASAARTISGIVMMAGASCGWICRASGAPVKGELDESEHVEGREPGAHKGQQPESPCAGGERFPEDLVLAEESRKWGDPGYGESADHKGPVRGGKVMLERAHLLNVLLFMHGMDDGTRTEEEERLEECMGHHMEHARGEGAHPEPGTYTLAGSSSNRRGPS